MTHAEIIPIGNLGNRMLQLILLESIKQRTAALTISGGHLPEWHSTPVVGSPLKEPRLRLKGQYVDIPLLSKLIGQNWIQEFEFAALGFQVGHYMSRDDCNKLFPRRSTALRPAVKNALLINVRGAEILRNVHEDYGPLPVAFYQQVIDESGLPPVFMGQVGDDEYSQLLRKAFPGATFLGSQGVLEDFELLRSASHVVAGVSTFSWLATWLSEAEAIHLPVSGIFNPTQRPDIDLLPSDDPRYRFHTFPVRRWTASAEQFADLGKADSFPRLSAEDVVRLRKRADRALVLRRASYRVRLLLNVLAHRHFNRGAWVGL